ncbi:MAG: flagellar biosynthesis anti-sigma factor FlgM [Clostridia bacterium]|nr:flagellar biosynthesis anti-sigma factor FlgM [Clostridia bacterium]
MKIWGNVPNVSGVYGNTSKINKTTKVGEVASKKDELSISGAAKDFSVVMKALRQVPDVRMDKVNEIAQKMERGEYNVSAKDVAGKMVDSLTSRKL